MDAYLARAALLLRLGRDGDALGAWSAAITAAQNRPDLYHERALIYVRKGMLDLAIADFTKELELKPDASAASDALGSVLAQRGFFLQAINSLTKGIEKKPTEARLYYSRGLTYHGTGKIDLAIADYTKASELQPDRAEFYVRRGWAYHQRGDDTKAMLDVDKAISAAPWDAQYLEIRGMIQESLHHVGEAIADYAQALTLDEHRTVAAQRLRRLAAGP